MATLFLDNGHGIIQIETEEKIDFPRLVDSLFKDTSVLTVRQIDEYGNEVGYSRKTSITEVTADVFQENRGYVVAMLTWGNSAIYILNIGGAWVQFQGRIIEQIRGKFSYMRDYNNFHVYFETAELFEFIKNNY